MYKAILIDMFNLAYRKSSVGANYKNIASSVIDFIEKEIKSRLEEDGTLYLIYDPISNNSFSITKNFKYNTTRQEIVDTYKKNRKVNPIIIDAISLVKKYYTFRGSKIKTVISKTYEADDFVEGIVKMYPTGTKIALITTDSDWTRYVSDTVEMFNKGFDKPYTKESYYSEFGVYPTIATVTMRKVLFGDTADGVVGVINNKSLHFPDDMDLLANDMIEYISKNNISLDDLESVFRKSESAKDFVFSHKDTPIEYFLKELREEQDAYTTIMDNIRVIKSRCLDPKPYIHSNTVDESYNNLMETTLQRANGQVKNSKFVFGGLKA